MTALRPTRTHRTRCVLAVLAVLTPVIALLAFASPAAGAQPPAPQNITVPIRNFAFSAADLSVHIGDTVTWVNEDRAPHDVTSTNGPASFTSGPLKQGQSYSYTFTAAGAYSYMCSIHPDMVATVTAMEHEMAPAAPPPAEAPPIETPPAAPPAEAVPPPTDGAPAVGAVPAAPGAPPVGPSAAPAPASAGAQPDPGTAQSAGAIQPTRQLDPLLIVAGVALGVATLCLLMVSPAPTGAVATQAGGAGVAAGSRPTATMTNPRHRTSESRNPLLLRTLAAIGLLIDGYVHFDLAADYDTVGTLITQGTLFRVQGAVAVLAALLIVLLGRTWVYQVVFLIAASALVPVVLYTYVDVGAIGPLPNMYEPVWYLDKTISAIGEAVAAVAAGMLAFRPRARTL